MTKSTESTRGWAGAALGFGALLALGSTGELCALASRGVLPAGTYAIPFMEMHHTATGLRAGVALSSTAGLVCAAVFARAGLRLWRGRPRWGWRDLAGATRALRATILLGLAVSTWYIFPMPVDAQLRAVTQALVVSMLGATGGMCLVLSLWHRLALRRLRVEA